MALKSKFGQNGPKIKIPSDLLENLYSSQLEGNECEFDIGILRFCTNSVFRQIGPKTKILIDLLENSHSRVLKVLNTNPI